MTASTIDLDALDAFVGLEPVAAAGKPVILDVDLVHEDPAQPRKIFDDAKQRELCASVAESGIRVPVSVRPHPLLTGHYMLNFGARRRRAALSVGLRQIPALIEELMTDFDQVIENLQRADLSPMEMALFISGKQKDGMKPAEIARRLGLSRSSISKFFALVDPPAEIEAVYASGRTTSPDTIYDLRLVFDRWPQETKTWLANDVDVTRRTIDQLKRTLLGQTVTTKPLRTKAGNAWSDEIDNIRRPVLHVRAGDQAGVLVLTQRPNTDGRLFVRWYDTGQEQAVDVSAIELVRLEERRQPKRNARGREMEPRR